MEITLEMIDEVRERTGVSHKKAKEALEAANGNIVEAIIAIEEGGDKKSDEIVAKIKKLVKEGNINKICVEKDGENILCIPVNVGIIGGIVGVAAAPWAVIAGAIAAYGFDCKVKLIRQDGSTIDIDE